MKKLKGIVLAVILLLASIMMPFDVYADSYVSPSYVSNTERDKWQNAGGNVVNFSEDPLTGSTPSKLTFTFNDNYYGFVSFQPYSGNSVWNDSTVFIAGGVGYYNYRNSSAFNPKYIDGVKITYVNLFLPDSNVDLSQIISILTAIENDTTSLDTTTDAILIDLQSVLNELIDANGYLEILTEMRKYDFPIESYNIISYQFGNNRVPLDFYNLEGYYTFPRFSINVNENICTSYFYGDYIDVVCLFSNPSGSFGVGNLGTNATFVNSEILNYFIDPLYGNSYLIRARYRGSGNFRMYLRSGTGVTFIPIFCGYTQNISTDYALLFGLNNRLLDNIQKIANGTNQSNTAASDLESSNSQMADDMDDLATIESGYNQQFNNQLQQIDFSSPLQSNAGILPAANFVISIFNGLINNNPFSVLIIIVCILLIGKKVIGK